MAEITSLPGCDLLATQMLRVIGSDEPDHVVVLALGRDGAWRASWTNMTLAELSLATHLLQAELLTRMEALLSGPTPPDWNARMASGADDGGGPA